VQTAHLSPRSPRGGSFAPSRPALPGNRSFLGSLPPLARQRGLFSCLTAFSRPCCLFSRRVVHDFSLLSVPLKAGKKRN
jgi:hypothetical protein